MQHACSTELVILAATAELAAHHRCTHARAAPSALIPLLLCTSLKLCYIFEVMLVMSCTRGGPCTPVTVCCTIPSCSRRVSAQLQQHEQAASMAGRTNYDTGC